MLPTPHGPAEPPAPGNGQGTQAAAGPSGTGETADPVVAAGRPPDAVALLRVVEHLADEADEPDGARADEDTAAAPTAGDAVQDAAQDAVEDEPTDEDPRPVTDAAPAAEVVGPVAAALSDTRHTVEELTAPERVFLAQQRALIAELCADPTDEAAVGALFDRVREQWTQADDRPDSRPLADAFGVALGDLVCLRAPDLGWATCSDRYGVEIVLARERPEVLVYPIASVGQSWATAPPGWFVTHLAHIVRGVTREPSPTDV